MPTREYHFVGLDTSSEFGVTKFKCALRGSLTGDMADRAREEAEQVLDKPLFVTSSGTPEIEVVICGATVQALFGRNCDQLPIVTVTDLDTANDPERLWEQRRQDLEKAGFSEIPAALYSVEG